MLCLKKCISNILNRVYIFGSKYLIDFKRLSNTTFNITFFVRTQLLTELLIALQVLFSLISN